MAVALRDTNDRYRAILGLKTDPPIPMATARIVTASRISSVLGTIRSPRIVATASPAGTTLDLPPRTDGFWLVWLTDLPPRGDGSYQAAIAELRFEP